jgi:hypothetical protein
MAKAGGSRVFGVRVQLKYNIIEYQNRVGEEYP